VYAIEQGVKKIGKANGLEAIEAGLLDFTIDARENVHCCPGAIGGVLFQSQLLE
jgi:hypothetical protein